MPGRSVTPAQLGAEVQRLLKEAGDKARAKVVRALQSAAIEAKGEAVRAIHDTKPYAPIDQQKLVQSYVVTNTPEGATLNNTAPHAVFVEFGTAPHWVPTAPLVAWAERKLRGSIKQRGKRKSAALLMAERVQLKIAHHGTDARGFHARASQKFPGIVERHVRAALGGP